MSPLFNSGALLCEVTDGQIKAELGAEEHTHGFSLRVSILVQLGWPGSQRNCLISSVAAMLSNAAVRHCSLCWNTIKWDNTRTSSYFPLAKKDQGLFSTHS